MTAGFGGNVLIHQEEVAGEGVMKWLGNIMEGLVQQWRDDAALVRRIKGECSLNGSCDEGRRALLMRFEERRC